jgi:uncharacterized protein YydD (DUF2326 family)
VSRNNAFPAKALDIGAEQSKEHGFQYIVTMNSDAVPLGEFSKGFDYMSVFSVRH